MSKANKARKWDENRKFRNRGKGKQIDLEKQEKKVKPIKKKVK